MIVVHRVASVASGKTADAMAFAQRVVSYLKSTYSLDIEIMLPIGGNPLRIAWVSRYKDLSAYDAMSLKGLADQSYKDLIGTGSDCFIPGSVQDSIWRTLG